MKKILLLVLCITLSCMLLACGILLPENNVGNAERPVDDIETNLNAIIIAYQKYKELGYEITLEGFIEMITGTTEDASAALQIPEINYDSDGNIHITLPDGTVLFPADSENDEDHEHDFGEWEDITGYAGILINSCEERLYQRVCSICEFADRKISAVDNHQYTVTTVEPTCSTPGYDIMTCSVCHKSIVCNEIEPIDHAYASIYSSDGVYHWKKCATCDDVINYALHTPNNEGICTVCFLPMNSSGGLVYELSEDGSYAYVAVYSSTDEYVLIADSYKGAPVTTIYQNAFRNNNHVQTVVIPNSVTTIGAYAFHSCASLAEVNIGKGVTTIESSAFAYCSALKSITIPDNVTSLASHAFSSCYALEDVTIGNGVTSIGNDAFRSCSALSSITIGNGVTEISKNAFYDCHSLTSLVIPDNVTSLGDHAFQNCTNLSEITIGGGVRSIGSYAFSSCYRLTDVHSSDLSDWCNITFGNTYANPLYYAKNLYFGGELLTALVLPTDVNKVHSYAFHKYDKLTEITLHDDVVSIGDSAFEACANIESATIGSSIETIGTSAFRNCIALTEITLPDTVSTIGASAFAYCSALTNVVIGNGVNTIGDSAFWSCTALTEINIPSSVILIGSNAFYSCSELTSLVMEDGVKTIGTNAFCMCKKLTSVVIPDSVTTIETSAFQSCSSLKNVTIGSGVNYIGAYAFYGCGNITSLVFCDPNGWHCSLLNDNNGMDIAPERLESASGASKLMLTYHLYYWTKA